MNNENKISKTKNVLVVLSDTSDRSSELLYLMEDCEVRKIKVWILPIQRLAIR